MINGYCQINKDIIFEYTETDELNFVLDSDEASELFNTILDNKEIFYQGNIKIILYDDYGYNEQSFNISSPLTLIKFTDYKAQQLGLESIHFGLALMPLKLAVTELSSYNLLRIDYMLEFSIDYDTKKVSLICLRTSDGSNLISPLDWGIRVGELSPE